MRSLELNTRLHQVCRSPPRGAPQTSITRGSDSARSSGVVPGATTIMAMVPLAPRRKGSRVPRRRSLVPDAHLEAAARFPSRSPPPRTTAKKSFAGVMQRRTHRHRTPADACTRARFPAALQADSVGDPIPPVLAAAQPRPASRAVAPQPSAIAAKVTPRCYGFLDRGRACSGLANWFVSLGPTHVYRISPSSEAP